MSEKILGIKQKDLDKLFCNLTKIEPNLKAYWDEPLSHYITRGQIQRFIKAKKDVPVVSIKWLEELLNYLDKKEEYKLVLEDGREFVEKMTSERKVGVYLATAFLKEKLFTIRKQAGVQKK